LQTLSYLGQVTRPCITTTRFFFTVLLLHIFAASTAQSGQDHITKLVPLDVKLNPPLPGEWMYIHHEKGQTFEQYKAANPVRPAPHEKKIYLQPLGEFSEIQKQVIEHTASYLTIFFQRETVVLPAWPEQVIPETGRRNSQFHTGTILDLLEKNRPRDGIVIMAITAKDLYPGKGWNFVFGQARTDKRVGVSSLYRYSPTKLSETNYHIITGRMVKTSSHEIGHMLSILHCSHAVCLMNGSNSLAEADSRPNRLCSECHKKLQWNLRFNVRTRLRQLNQYFTRHKLDRDRKLVEKDLEMLAP
jgi:archaemetzincin